ncbi:hypothetical protein AAVH_08653, partial [Aphelenchoides avenae]
EWIYGPPERDTVVWIKDKVKKLRDDASFRWVIVLRINDNPQIARNVIGGNSSQVTRNDVDGTNPQGTRSDYDFKWLAAGNGGSFKFEARDASRGYSYKLFLIQ